MQDFEKIFSDIIDGKTAKEDAKKILLEINEIGFTSDTFLGAMSVLKKRMKKITAPKNAIDVCGTGGDGLNTLNVSTATCFVLAACGVTIAKHGNKAISSKSGSADIFNELGIETLNDIDKIEETLRQKKLCFLFAPFFHESLKNLAQIRKEIAQEYNVPTIFNYLGPLLNPASTTKQMIGVSRRDIMPAMAEALKKSATKKAYLVHGFDKMDEVTLCDNSYLLRLQDDRIYEEETVNPEDYGFKKCTLKEIEGKDPAYNAQKLKELLQGEKSPYLDIVVLNSAFALNLSDDKVSIEEGVAMAKNAIDNGDALNVLESLQG